MKHQDKEMVINFSGGKDSCAMLAYLCENYPDVRKHVILADTGWEHEDVVQWCEGIVARYGLTLNVTRNKNKTFLEMVERRGKFPGMKHRQCTSDLKRNPIQTWIRQNVPGKMVVNCMGLRAAESAGRAKAKKLKINAAMTNNKRTVWDWLPIHGWSDEEVFAYLAERNIPLHPVYNHLRRFSCRVCIFSSVHDVQQVAKHDPAAIRIIADMERRIGFTMFQSGPIESIIS